jgi:hypothetical protein
MTDNPQPAPTGWSRYFVEARIVACVAVLAAAAWFGAQVIWSRYVAGSLAIALLYSASVTLRTVWVRRQGWRGAIGLGLLLLAVIWPLLWLGLTYKERHPYG